ncbi:MAG: ParM/StbA family protein [Pseudomonadota bacterium]
MSATASKTQEDTLEEQAIQLGMDDGFYNTKIAGPNGTLFCIPSRVRTGPSRVIGMAGNSPEISEFRVGDVTYSAGEVSGESTMFDEYPVSNLNRVMSHHSLHAAGFGGKRVKLASGLPIRLYYKGLNGEVNEQLIEKKINNLQGDIELLSAAPSYGGNTKPVDIIEHNVCPEGQIAWYHFVIEEKVGGQVHISKGLHSIPMGFIDIGGRTTSLSVVEGGQVDLERSGSINAGMLDVRKQVGGRLINEFDLADASDNMIDSALNTGTVLIYGKSIRVSKSVNEAKASVLEHIRDEAKRIFGLGNELAEIKLFGGAYRDFQQQLEEAPLFKRQEVADNPLYVNAIAMYKLMRYVSK